MKRRAIAIAVISVAAAVAGCDSTPRQTITGAEAIQRLDGYLAEATSAVASDLRVVRTTAEATYTGGCTKVLSGSDFTGQVEAEVEYTAKDVPPETATKYLDALGQFWTGRWGTIDRSEDGVRVSIDSGQFQVFGLYYPAVGKIVVGGVSGCVWPHGTPEPHP